MPIHLVEDDESARVATERFLRAAGHAVVSYATVEEFLAKPPADEPGCVILDLRLPDGTGLELQRVLASREDSLPVIFLTGHGDVHDSVQAMKWGAVDFLMKTDGGEMILEAVGRALERHAAERSVRARRRELRQRYETLTVRERDVFAHLITGSQNKQVGYALGIAVGTIKIHRQRVMAKMGAQSLPDLARMAGDLQIPSSWARE